MSSLSMSGINKLPKVELHVHLDTSLSLDNVRQFVPHITYATYHENYVAPEKCGSLTRFLEYVHSSASLLQTSSSLSQSLCRLMVELAADNVYYAEIRMAPLLHTNGGLSLKEAANAICQGLRQGHEAAPSLVARLIFCTLRHFTEGQSLDTARLAVAYRDRGVVGFDLAADESAYPVDNHVSAFEYAAANGLCLTAHAGEGKGPESVWEVLDKLRVRRIGHGVRSIEDPALVASLKENNIHLEICPSSNIQTGIYHRMEDHPVDALFHAGIPLSINTDGRGLLQHTLSQQYKKVMDTFGWGLAEWQNVNQMALQAAFCDPVTKDRIYERLQSDYTILRRRK